MYDVHQYARVLHNPRRSHKMTVEHILRYLKGTKDKGIVMALDKVNIRIDLYADADFAGLFTLEN